MKSKHIKTAVLIFISLLLLLCIFYLLNILCDRPKTPAVRHDNVNLSEFLILESFLGDDDYELFTENARHRNLGFAMQFMNRSYYYIRPGLGFFEGVVHYEDSDQAYSAFQGYLYHYEELDTKKPSLVHPEYKKDKSIHWYAGIVPPDENGIALNLFYAQYDDVIVFYEIALPVSILDEAEFIEIVKKLDANAKSIMDNAILVDPLLPTFTPLPGMPK